MRDEKAAGPHRQSTGTVFELVQWSGSWRIVVHDRGIWEHVAYLGGKTPRHIRIVLRDRRKLETHQRFALGSKYAAVWLKQKGFTGAIDVVEVGDK